MAFDRAHTSPRSNWTRGLVNSSTEGDFPALVPTTTKPATVDSTTTGANLVVWEPHGVRSLIMPFGVGADNTTFAARITVWRTVVVAGTTTLYVPELIASAACTNSALVGFAGASLIATERLADTIVLSLNDTRRVTSYDEATGDLSPAVIEVRHEGAELIEVTFDMGTATSGNILYTDASW